MKPHPFVSRFLAVLLCCILSSPLFPACGKGAEPPSLRTKHLEKLCLVWGYAKYTHPAFLSGRKDWDAELLSLTGPVMESESSDQVNALLSDWLNSIGPVDYGSDFIDQTWAGLEQHERVYLAQDDWLADKAFLGERLVQSLSSLREIPVVYRGRAPVYASPSSPDGITVRFDNEPVYPDVDYADEGWRLLCLFRLWNAAEYFYPYLDVLDEDWHALLPVFIDRMLEGNDRESCQLTLHALAARLQDAHVVWADSAALTAELGAYAIPASYLRTGNCIAIDRVYEDCGLEGGDVILSVDGTDADDLIARCMEYISVPSPDKPVNALGCWLLRSPRQDIELTVLRGGEELSLTVRGTDRFYLSRVLPDRPHETLEGNIGLINPAWFASEADIRAVMDAYASHDGLIIDLRQPSAVTMHKIMAEYLVSSRQTFALWRYPSWTIPGAYAQYDYAHAEGKGLYSGPVVLLIDERTQSHGEFAAMALASGENTVLMGTPTCGADGNVALLPMPDGNIVQFTAYGVLTAEGNHTQRAGIVPDIRAEYTISGLAEGRDEVLDSAVQYLLGK